MVRHLKARGKAARTRSLADAEVRQTSPRTHVAFGDKVIGTNHTLPTNRAAR